MYSSSGVVSVKPYISFCLSSCCWLGFLLRSSPWKNNPKKQCQFQFPTEEVADGCFEAQVKRAGCRRRLTHHCSPTRPPVRPWRLVPDRIRTAFPRNLWESRCRAGSPPAGSGCLDRTAMSPAAPNLRTTASTLNLKTH